MFYGELLLKFQLLQVHSYKRISVKKVGKAYYNFLTL